MTGPKTWFDPQWYFHQYPDVAKAGVNPYQHYLTYGQFEGRQPGPNRTIAWAHHLWRGLSEIMLPRLETLVTGETTPPHERVLALTELLVWYGAEQRWVDVQRLARSHEALLTQARRIDVLSLLWFEAELALGSGEAPTRLAELKQHFPTWPCAYLAEANLSVAAFQAVPTHVNSSMADSAWLAAVNALLAKVEPGPLLPLALAPGNVALFDRLQAGGRAGAIAQVDKPWQRFPVLRWLPGVALPLVTVVVPAYNAGTRLLTALRSLEAQTWPNLEVIVVNDASNDKNDESGFSDYSSHTAAIAETFCHAASQRLLPGQRRYWRVVHHGRNQGAYAARNTGVQQALGAFITVHDADDWSHPQKIEIQAQRLRSNRRLKGTLSQWARLSQEGQFSRWLIEEGWVYRNLSSLMVRASVVKTLGYWDDVRVNADTEYYDRVRAAFGPDSLVEVMPGVPLAFGRHDPASLSQSSATHLRTQFMGVRKNYMDAAHRWHKKARSPQDLYLPRHPAQRPFLAPEAICRDAGPVVNLDPRDRVQQSGWFDPVWYISVNPDLQEQALDAFDHWWNAGAAEGRDPSPQFSVSGYRARYAGEVGAQNPLDHFLTIGKARDYQPKPHFEGQLGEHSGQPWVLVCAHQAGHELFGAERSLLDVLSALQANRFNVHVVLPSAVNKAYTQVIAELAQAWCSMPLPWWRQGRPSYLPVQHCIEGLLAARPYRWVYLNTLVHYEAALAARASNVPVVMHVRELPEEDPSLCQALGASPQQIQQHVAVLADRVVANSRFVADQIGLADRCTVMPNVVAAELFADIPFPDFEGLAVGLISSNLPKKGLSDFVELARQLAVEELPIRCVLIGPDNDHTRALASQDVPSNLALAGYAKDAQAALAQLDVVVNLSHFQESFGRTVLEAMAAGRPVVAYHWGALPELVAEGETGFLVPKGDVAAVARRLRQLAADPALRHRMGEAGRARARALYSPAQMASGLPALLVLGTRADTRK